MKRMSVPSIHQLRTWAAFLMHPGVVIPVLFIAFAVMISIYRDEWLTLVSFNKSTLGMLAAVLILFLAFQRWQAYRNKPARPEVFWGIVSIFLTGLFFVLSYSNQETATNNAFRSISAYNCSIANILISKSDNNHYTSFAYDYYDVNFYLQNLDFVYKQLGLKGLQDIAHTIYSMNYSNKLQDNVLLLNVPNSSPADTQATRFELNKQIIALAHEIRNLLRCGDVPS